MTIINNYNYFGGSSTEGPTNRQTSTQWIEEDCIARRKVALTPSSVKRLNDDNRVIIRANGKVYFIEIDLIEPIRPNTNNIGQPVYRINRVAGTTLESTFKDYIRSNVGSNGNYFRCSTLNSDNHRDHLDNFWNNNVNTSD